MRKLTALALVLVTATLTVPVSVFAQSAGSTQVGSIMGEVVDAGGRALVGQRVELLQNAEIVQTTTTGSRGEWMFAGVAPGDYIVRTVLNGQVAGIRVAVASGQLVTNAMIVVPSAAVASPVFLAALGLLGGLATVAAIVVAVVTTVVVTTGS